MKSITVNPFKTTGYDLPEYFCNRSEETFKLLDAVSSQRNITLISLRRMGKTALIHHLFHKLKSKKDVACFYLDILPTNSLKDFIEHFGKSVLGKLDSTPAKSIKKIVEFFSGIRPSISYDTITGEPSVEFNLLHPQQAERTLEQIFTYLQKQEKKIVIAMDEFQQISSYSEKNIEALLRSNIQKLHNVNFIFSGSRKHLLLAMFAHQGRPFYQSTEILHLEKINRQEYSHFIKLKFEMSNKYIMQEDIDYILEWTECFTYYVQYAFNRIFSIDQEKISTERIKEKLLEVLRENEIVYYNYRNLVTDFQWRLMKAIATEREVKMITAGEFISKYKLTSPSSVKTALHALMDREMIYEENGFYKLYDVFLARWLERNK